MPKYKIRNINHLSPETQVENFNKLVTQLKEILSEDRIANILNMFNDLEDQLVMAPASPSGHGAYHGGLIEHMLDSITFAKFVRKMFSILNTPTPSEESCILCSAFHDLGKVGNKEIEHYIVEDSDWHREHMNRNFRINLNEETVLHHADRSIYLLQKYGVELTEEEFQAIRVHDGPGAQINTWSPYGWNISFLAKFIRVVDYMASSYREQLDNES